MSTILNVDADPKGFWGVIETDMCYFSWKYDSELKCCEDFGVQIDYPLSELEGKKFRNLDFDSSSATLTIYLDNDEDDNDDVMDLVKELVDNKRSITRKELSESIKAVNSVTIRFYNEHNGYYCHNLDILVDGSLKWNLAL